MNVEKIMQDLERKHPGEAEFLQAVREVLLSIEDVYNQHLQNFNDADWSKEITNCQENYKVLSVKYENVQTGIWTNIIIMA